MLAKAGLYSHVATGPTGSIAYTLNSRSTRVAATVVPGAETPPANLAQTFLGWHQPAASVNDWLAMLEAVNAEDLIGGMLFVNTTSLTIQAAVMAWIVDQRSRKGATFRAFFGAQPGLSEATYRSIASGFNSTNATLACQRILAPGRRDATAPALCRGHHVWLASGVPNAQTTTNLAIRAARLDRQYPLAIRENDECRALRPERSERARHCHGLLPDHVALHGAHQSGAEREYGAGLHRPERAAGALDFLGAWATKDLIPQVKGRVTDVLALLTQQGIITPGLDQQGRILPAYFPPSVGFEAGLLRVIWQAWIGGEIRQLACWGRWLPGVRD